jgi:hypothetical protein
MKHETRVGQPGSSLSRVPHRRCNARRRPPPSCISDATPPAYPKVFAFSDAAVDVAQSRRCGHGIYRMRGLQRRPMRGRRKWPHNAAGQRGPRRNSKKSARPKPTAPSITAMGKPYILFPRRLMNGGFQQVSSASFFLLKRCLPHERKYARGCPLPFRGGKVP